MLSRIKMPRLTEIATLFLKLGTISFGGPAAHIALMEDEVVRRRRWLSHEEFMDLIGATNLIPGPNSTEMAIHIGLRKAGWAGFLVAGGCFVLPATVIVTFCAWLYVRYGSLPEAGALLYGVKPVMIAVVLQALWALGRAALKTKTLLLLAAAAAILNFLGVNELVILFGAGLLFAFTRSSFLRKSQTQYFSLAPLFLFFLKTGSVLFGSGYVLLAFLRADLVERWHWLSEGQLLDAIAVGQFTPGPVFTTATFIGYILGRTPGAIVATLGIFLPAFVFVALSGPFIPRIRRSETAGAFLDAVNASSLALMAVVTWQLGHSAVVDVTSLVLAVGSAIVLFRFRVNSAWLVLGGALVGLIFRP
ncbi:MAG: chromate transporter [Acidobacteria bacterium]|nr:MAG: chromate transporter [Acidobacteriota bacterium]